MSDNKRKATVVDPVPVVVQFWALVEKLGRYSGKHIDSGKPISQGTYYGLRITDRIEVGNNPASSIQAIWQNYMEGCGVNADLATTSRVAAAKGLLRTNTPHSKDKETGKDRSWGQRFWTPSNPVYVAKAGSNKTTSSPKAAAEMLLNEAVK